MRLQTPVWQQTYDIEKSRLETNLSKDYSEGEGLTLSFCSIYSRVQRVSHEDLILFRKLFRIQCRQPLSFQE